MEFYCLKCRKKVEVAKYTTEIKDTRSGKRKILKGICPKSGTKVTRIAKM